jgi:hypothetical protein
MLPLVYQSADLLLLSEKPYLELSIPLSQLMLRIVVVKKIIASSATFLQHPILGPLLQLQLFLR